MADNFSALAKEAAALYSQIEEFEESYCGILDKISGHILKNFSRFEYPDAPDGIYWTALNVEHERYGTPIEKRRNWCSCVFGAKQASSFCEVDDDPYCRIEDDMVKLGGTAWYYDGERNYISVEIPLRWLDLDRDGVLADLARLKEEADAEEREAAAVIEEAESRKEAAAEAAAEAEEYETYLKLKAKYEGGAPARYTVEDGMACL